MYEPRGREGNLDDMPPGKALLMMRIIWGALLLGQLAFMGILGVLIAQGGPAVGRAEPLLPIINVAMLVIVVPVTFVVRRVVHRRALRPDGTVRAAAYSTGNIIFWAGCEGPSFFGLVIAMLNRSFWPTILITAVAMGLQVMTIPKMAAIKARDETFKIE